MNGIIFDIQRGSYVDGPGIRTTVFFKGCNLKCAWCHNPEGQNFKPQILYYKNKCKDCGICKDACQHKEACILCGKCTYFCPNDAKILCGKTYSSKEIVNIVKKDFSYYTSGGGVTFSGGECMLQIDFLEELLKECKKAGIHTAVDTAGCVPYDSFDRILPYTDLFLFDIKLISKSLHIKYTGSDNHLILENLKKLLKSGKKIWIRIPIIAEVNDSVEEMLKIKDFLKNNGYPEKVELLPYHAMGEHKFAAIGRSFTAFKAPSKEKMNELNKIFN